MKAVLQRVNSAKVEVDNKIYGKINKGILVLIGISKDFTEDKLEWMVKKILNIRLWPSEKKGFDLSVNEIKGEILIVSQFTLHGIVEGNKPNFKNSAEYEKAKNIYNRLIEKLKEESIIKIETGVFGANMKVSLENDGPVTIILEK